MSLLVLTNNTSLLSVQPPTTVKLKVGLTPAGVQGIQGDKGDKGEQGIQGVAGSDATIDIAQTTGTSTTSVTSQKLLTDELISTNARVDSLEADNGTFKNIKDNVTLRMWVGTQAELDAIVVKEATVIYMVKS